MTMNRIAGMAAEKIATELCSAYSRALDHEDMCLSLSAFEHLLDEYRMMVDEDAYRRAIIDEEISKVEILA